MLNSEQLKTLVETGSVSVVRNGVAIEFRCTQTPYSSLRAPWLEYDGYGVVSGWEARHKLPNERILAQDGRFCLFYDVTATIEKARKEGWSIPEGERQNLTHKQIIAKAVERDFRYCQRWAAGEIWWTILKLAVYVDDVELDGATQSLGGVESNLDTKDLVAAAGDLVAQAEAALRADVESKAQTFAALQAVFQEVA